MNERTKEKRRVPVSHQPRHRKSYCVSTSKKNRAKKQHNPQRRHSGRNDVSYAAPLPAIRRQLMILDRIGFLIFGVSIVAQIVVSVAACACSEALGLGWTFFFGVLGFVQCLIATFAMVAIRSARINIESEFNAIRKQINSGRKK